MKKFFIMIAIAGAVASCNDSSTSGMSHDDSVRMQDSIDKANMNNPSTPMTPDTGTMNMNGGDTMGKKGMSDTGMMKNMDTMMKK